ncbi:rifin [Plasmodium reichenowi]|uniref:Rifin n=1 Tax=Plasmodium reichenowi TaxID=5854 RepID=A0A060RMH4_PLARE|nr:rifin [Plasmodium reichenowi]
MKVHYINILLFALPLNVLVNTHRKPYVRTPHIRTTTSRVLSEKDIRSTNYDKDADMKSVKENFDRQTSQRFEEYQERMKDKRQKRKEERDKNIQEIIEKDKMEISLEQKIEKGCLKCGCALGGGVLPVWGLVSGIWYATLSQHATKLAIEKGIEKGIQVGLAEVIKIAKPLSYGQEGTTPAMEVLRRITTGKFNDEVTLYGIFKCINSNVEGLEEAQKHGLFYQTVKTMVGKGPNKFNSDHQAAVEAVASAFENGKALEFASHTSSLSNTIIASVVTILVIVLIMVIIYLVLRYRRKKKMKKKAQYTKLLNQ